MIADVNMLSFCKQIATLYPDLRWNIDIPADLILPADENLLRQVFINLTKNAIEAEAKTIGIKAPSTSPFGGVLYVSNDGHVIPLDVAQEIFVPFFTTKQNGSGIGLSLSRQILMMQGMTLGLAESPQSDYNVTFVIEKN